MTLVLGMTHIPQIPMLFPGDREPHALPWGQGGKNAGVAPTGKDLCIWLRSQNLIKE